MASRVFGAQSLQRPRKGPVLPLPRMTEHQPSRPASPAPRRPPAWQRRRRPGIPLPCPTSATVRSPAAARLPNRRRCAHCRVVIWPLVCIIHECAGQRGFEAFGAGCSWSWRSAGRRRRLSSVADRLGARVWLIPSTLLPGSGAAPKRERIRGRELRGYPLKAPKARAI
jgi:hypothetical protein